MSQNDMLGPLMRVLVDIPQERLPLIKDFCHKVAGADSEEWVKQGNLFLRKKPNWTEPGEEATSPNPAKAETRQPVSILRFISTGESIVIPACDGSESLASADDVFNYIDGDFKNWDLDFTSEATPETPTSVYEMDRDANFKGMFFSLNTDLNKLAFSQHQIKEFVQSKDCAKWLRGDGYATFFLFKKGKGKTAKYFVARVYVYSDGYRLVYVRRFGYADVWRADDRHRLVVPKMEQSVA